MSLSCGLLAVIPARGGSKGIPGKNVRPFMGIPLISHSILFSKMCIEIDKCVVSTDSDFIAETAERYGGWAPFRRPYHLSQDDTPMLPVLLHALAFVEEEEGRRYDRLLLLDPTSPAREPLDVTRSLKLLEGNDQADGVIAVSQPDFNPIWHCVVNNNGWMTDLMDQGSDYDRRQDVPPVYRINGALYLWRTDFLRKRVQSWRKGASHLMYEIPELRAMSFDTEEEFIRAELLVKNGMIQFPWLDQLG